LHGIGRLISYEARSATSCGKILLPLFPTSSMIYPSGTLPLSIWFSNLGLHLYPKRGFDGFLSFLLIPRKNHGKTRQFANGFLIDSDYQPSYFGYILFLLDILKI
jgi:hypothetical protein